LVFSRPYMYVCLFRIDHFSSRSHAHLVTKGLKNAKF